ncbi:hypothetical protein EVAR_33111_1 [Eumeta japonica]|uniref:Uncharacterized protein n=1 Tax=Eumeta variegata TaxID=151549 RepID=A0A4C1YBM6_EUMVA|nr:hypothetical protein EVAR_33111_1 [Eumeta japonica]
MYNPVATDGQLCLQSAPAGTCPTSCTPRTRSCCSKNATRGGGGGDALHPQRAEFDRRRAGAVPAVRPVDLPHDAPQVEPKRDPMLWRVEHYLTRPAYEACKMMISVTHDSIDLAERVGGGGVRGIIYLSKKCSMTRIAGPLMRHEIPGGRRGSGV